MAKTNAIFNSGKNATGKQSQDVRRISKLKSRSFLHLENELLFKVKKIKNDMRRMVRGNNRSVELPFLDLSHFFLSQKFKLARFSFFSQIFHLLLFLSLLSLFFGLSAVCASRSSPSDCGKAPTSGSSLALSRRPRKQLELGTTHPCNLSPASSQPPTKQSQ